MTWLGRTVGAAYAAAAYAFIFLPVILLVVFSFQDATLPIPPFRGPTLRWYESLAGNERMISALVNSLIVGLSSASVATLLAFLAAYGLARHRPRAAAGVRAVLVAPVTVSYLVIGLGLSIAFNGLGIGRSLGLVIVGHVVINLPIALIVILSQMTEAQENMERAARDLGASERHVLALITAPLLLPAILAAFLLSFTLSWDEFVIAFLLSRFEVTLPVEIWSALRTGLDPETNAVGAVVFALSAGFVLVSYVLVTRLARRSR